MKLEDMIFGVFYLNKKGEPQGKEYFYSIGKISNSNQIPYSNNILLIDANYVIIEGAYTPDYFANKKGNSYCGKKETAALIAYSLQDFQEKKRTLNTSNLDYEAIINNDEITINFNQLTTSAESAQERKFMDIYQLMPKANAEMCNDTVRISPYGIACIDNNNQFFAYNKITDQLINVTTTTKDIKGLFFSSPVNIKTIQVGDLIKSPANDNEMGFVSKINSNSLEMFITRSQEKKEILLISNLLGVITVNKIQCILGDYFDFSESPIIVKKQIDMLVKILEGTLDEAEMEELMAQQYYNTDTAPQLKRDDRRSADIINDTRVYDNKGNYCYNVDDWDDNISEKTNSNSQMKQCDNTLRMSNDDWDSYEEEEDYWIPQDYLPFCDCYDCYKWRETHNLPLISEEEYWGNLSKECKLANEPKEIKSPKSTLPTMPTMPNEEPAPEMKSNKVPLSADGIGDNYIVKDAGAKGL